MSLHGIYNPMVREYFEKNGGGGGSNAADIAIANMMAGQPYELISNAATEVADNTFAHDWLITKVNLPNVTSVGLYAFNECTNMSEVNLPKATNIGRYAFYQCESLQEINAPNVTEIGENAFESDANLVYVNFPKAKYLRQAAFKNSMLEKADFGNLEVIAKECFYSSPNLTALIVRTTSTVCAVQSLDAVYNTPLLRGEGHIYVPASMISTYRAAYSADLGDMVNILFRKIEDYPEICG